MSPLTPTPTHTCLAHTRHVLSAAGWRGLTVCGSSVKAGIRDEPEMCSGCLVLLTHTPGPVSHKHRSLLLCKWEKHDRNLNVAHKAGLSLPHGT